MISALLLTSALLFAGLLLRARLRVLQVLYIPAAITGGLIGLAILQYATRAAPALTRPLVDELSGWPGILISVVFAGLFLDKPAKPIRQVIRPVVRQANMVWVISIGQVAIGLLAVWLIIEPLRLPPFNGDVPIYFGQLIEAGFVGGHGTSAALGEVYKNLEFDNVKDYAFFMATIGLIYSVVSGLVFVNLAVRRHWFRDAADVELATVSGLEAANAERSLGMAKVNAEVLDPLVFQAILLAGAYAVGLGLQTLINFFVYDGLPLFLFTLIGGWIVRDAMSWLGLGHLIDPETIRRLVAAAMEYLIVAAIASLNLTLVIQSIAPLMVLLLAGFVWSAICLLVIGRRLLPQRYWFELGIINYGMSTGVTASGLMLLRIIDKDFESGAAEDYALAAPLSSPFVGGGLITLVVIPKMLMALGTATSALILLGAVGCLLLLGHALARDV